MGLDPRIWGPKGWFFLHSIALNYPKNPTEKDKQNFKTFFESIQNVLPCPQCSKHYKENFENNSIDSHLDNNISLNKWLVEMHNSVNNLYNKPTITYEQFLINYKDIYNNFDNNILFDYNKLFIIFIIILVFILIYKRFK